VTFFCISDTLVPTTYLVDTTLSNSSDSDQTVQAVRLRLKPVFRAFYQQNAPLIYVTFAVYEGTGSGT
ncbi:hypothetical protein, partial [Escherichia coli]|uniref:hypothetical protein n=1 Tax=Escherichia coli TaxID=562 RepID=UPI0021BF40C4